MRNLTGVLTAATLLAGCTAYSTIDPLQTSGSLLKSEGSVTVKTIFTPGSYSTAAVVPTLTASAVDHVRLELFSFAEGRETPLKDASGSALIKRLAADEAQAGVAIGGLNIGQTYRIRAVAYESPEATPDERISNEAVMEFKLDKAKHSTQLELQLHDVPFDGIGTAPGIEITPSGELSHEGPIGIEFAPKH